MNQVTPPSLRSIRSFVIREGRFTPAQKKAFDEFWLHYGIPNSNENIKFADYFSKSQPLVLDVGFGSGDSLIDLAQQRPDFNFIGVEVYRPGIGNTMRKLNAQQIENVRIINADVLEVLHSNVADHCLHGIVVWFPDPWPKKRHHKRRLVQAEFLQQAARAIKTGGILHIASDWQPYVQAIVAEASREQVLQKLDVNVNPLKLKRPHTRFEQRGLRLGHKVTDLFYQVKE